MQWIAVQSSRDIAVRSFLSRQHTIRQFASTSTAYNDIKNTHQRDKLHIGFASLSNTLPFDPSDNNTESNKQQLVGDTELDTQATIMLTALRGGVTKFDIPAPPKIESNKVLPPSNANSITCWNANRQSEVQLSKSFDQAWNALLEEDDTEAQHVLNDNGTVITIASRLGYRSAVVLSDEEVHDAMDNTDINDSQEREDKFTGDARVGMLFAGKEEDDESVGEAQSAVVLVHNLSKDYVLHSLRTSPLVQQYKLNTESSSDAPKKIELISLAHNPETQMAAYLLSNHQANDGSTLAVHNMLECQSSIRGTIIKII